MKKTVSLDAVSDLLAAARAAVNHLAECEAGRIVHPFKSRSLPLLQKAISHVEREIQELGRKS